jgi:FkbM family methyltransferase
MRKLAQALANKMGYRVTRIRGPFLPWLPGPNISITELVFAVLNNVRGGNVRFIQVGAYDGEFQDPLYNWICHHPWLGVLVEPQPAMYERLIRLHASHPLVSVERAVVAEKTGKATLWTLTGPAEDATPLASLKREVVERNKHLDPLADHVSSIEVDAYTLYDLMIKHRFDELDLLQKDPILIL